MAIERPALSAIVNRMASDIQARLTTVQLRRSNANVYARAFAGASHILHGVIEHYSRQILADTAEGQFLERHGSKYGITRKPSSKAVGSIRFTFSNAPVTVPIGTILQTPDGIQCETTSGVVDGIASAKALLAGASGNIDEGMMLTLTTPIAGVKSEALCLGILNGLDQEDDESLRSRILERQSLVPMGGSKADYVRWALEVPGVTRAWCYPLENGDGTVVVRFVCDNEESLIPTSQKVSEVSAYIAERQPATAAVSIVAPQAYPIPFTFTTLSPNDEATRAQIKAELVALFERESEPGVMILLSHIRAAISASAAENDFALSSPSANVIVPNGYIATVGEITWPTS